MGRIYIFTEWKILKVKIMHADLFYQESVLSYLITRLLLNWDSQQGRDRETSGRKKKRFQLGQSYSILWGKSGIIKFEFKPT